MLQGESTMLFISLQCNTEEQHRLISLVTKLPPVFDLRLLYVVWDTLVTELKTAFWVNIWLRAIFIGYLHGIDLAVVCGRAAAWASEWISNDVWDSAVSLINAGATKPPATIMKLDFNVMNVGGLHQKPFFPPLLQNNNRRSDYASVCSTWFLIPL